MKARAAVAVILLCAGCSSSSGGKAHTNSVVAPKDATIASMLTLLPDNAATRGTQITVNLYWNAAQAGHIAVPPASASNQTWGGYLSSLGRDPLGMAESTLTAQLLQYGRQAQQLSGFDAANVTADIEAPALPKEYIAARGTFDRKTIDKAVHNDPKWKSRLETPKYNGTTVYRWLADNVVNLKDANTGLFTQTGGSRRFAFPNDSTFLYAKADPEIHDMLKSGARLVDAPDFTDLAKVLDKNGVYSAEFLQPRSIGDFLTSGRTFTPAAAAKLRAQLKKHSLAPYQRAAIGATLVNGEPEDVLCLANGDHATAQKNVGKLRDVLTAGYSVDKNSPWSADYKISDISATGTTTVAVLKPNDSDLWTSVFDDSLLVHS